MRTWTAIDKKCCICGIEEGEQYPFVIDEKKVGVEAKIVEIKRRFNKENEVIFSVCTRCQLLHILDDEREFFRYDFQEGELQPTKEELENRKLEETAKKIDGTNKDLEALDKKLSILQEEFEKYKADEADEALKAKEVVSSGKEEKEPEEEKPEEPKKEEVKSEG